MGGKVEAAQHIVTQLNIRNNVREMQESVKDLYSWGEEMKENEANLKSKGKQGPRRAPPVRGKADAVQASSNPSLHQPASKLVPGALIHIILMITYSGCGVQLCHSVSYQLTGAR
jgi:hypothetical protein